MSVYEILCDAIQNKRRVACEYDGLYREMCPHVIGMKHDTRHVLSYQFDGESRQGLPPDGMWRCMNMDGITNPTIIEGE